jgi:hypothetical protein
MVRLDLEDAPPTPIGQRTGFSIVYHRPIFTAICICGRRAEVYYQYMNPGQIGTPEGWYKAAVLPNEAAARRIRITAFEAATCSPECAKELQEREERNE